MNQNERSFIAYGGGTQEHQLSNGIWSIKFSSLFRIIYRKLRVKTKKISVTKARYLRFNFLFSKFDFSILIKT